uniref:Uncharacterized protein n=1 Tax=Picea glauca TaxID=3330 RepID=A0A101M5X1_PICGL|nr:hypothetical protein ABT39_MTgene1292 [Picea glauca]QHR87242.1 hypothetical protein Q903MT_gene1251 [Picea sitchensis]
MNQPWLLALELLLGKLGKLMLPSLLSPLPLPLPLVLPLSLSFIPMQPSH